MIQSTKDDPTDVTLLCPKCGGHFADARKSQFFSNKIWWEIYECRNQKCLEGILVEYEQGQGINLLKGRIAYPYSSAPTIEGVPEKASFNYDQAVRSLSAGAYNAATVMARACIEAIAKEKQAEGENLKQKLKWLNEQRLITPLLYEWADDIREWGNEMVHELEPIDADRADYIVQFSWKVIEHLYIDPAQFAKIRRPPSENG